jgi:hypothetical protein
VALTDRFDEILRGLPRGWERARLDVSVEEPEDADRASLILAPATPGRSGRTFRVHVYGGTTGLAPTPQLARRVIARLDEAGIPARISLGSHEEPPPAPAPAAAAAETREALAASWDSTVRRLPPDWSDLYAEVELDSTDFLDRGALLLAPVNPARHGGPTTFRFRAARHRGYGVASGMARRAFERLDEEGVTGRVRVLRVLSDSSSTFTQGPVWRVDGRSV